MVLSHYFQTSNFKDVGDFVENPMPFVLEQNTDWIQKLDQLMRSQLATKVL